MLRTSIPLALVHVHSCHDITWCGIDWQSHMELTFTLWFSWHYNLHVVLLSLPCTISLEAYSLTQTSHCNITQFQWQLIVHNRCKCKVDMTIINYRNEMIRIEFQCHCHEYKRTLRSLFTVYFVTIKMLHLIRAFLFWVKSWWPEIFRYLGQLWRVERQLSCVQTLPNLVPNENLQCDDPKYTWVLSILSSKRSGPRF